MANYYQVLGVSITASDQEIKASFKKLAVQFHPDKHGGDPYYEERFKQINQAYQVLSNPALRKRYDLKLQYGLHSGNASTQKQTHKQPSQNQPPKYTYRKKQSRPSKKPSGKKYYGLFVTLVFGLLIGSGGLIYSFMNEYATEKYYSEGEMYYQENAYQAALVKYLDVLQVDPEHSESYERLGDIQSGHLKDYEGALGSYLMAIKHRDTISPDLLLKQGKVMNKLDMQDIALQSFRTISRLAPDYDSAWFYSGEVYMQKKEFSEAATAYGNAYRVNHEFEVALYRQSLAMFYLGQHKKSLELINSLLQKDPNNGGYFMLRGKNNLHLQDTILACKDFYYARMHNFPSADSYINDYCK